MALAWNTIRGRTGYILTGEALLATYRLDDRNIVLVDSGTDPDPDLIPFLRARDAQVYAVLHTHLHVDHVANSRALAQAFGARLLATPPEIASVSSIEALASHLGNLPPKFLDLIHRTACFPTEPIPEDAEEITLLGTPFQIRRLPGHSIGHIGFVTPDNVLCAGDAILSPYLAQHSRMPYCEYVGLHLETLQMLLEEEPYPYYALAHMEVIEGRDIRGLLRQNIRLYRHICDEIVDMLNGPEEYEDFLDTLMHGLNLIPRNSRYQDAIRFAVRCKVDYLVRSGRIRESQLVGLTLLRRPAP